MHKGWFKIDGVQDGDRSVQEQLTGLEDLLAMIAGKRVLDLGCAEGLIAKTLLDRGAEYVRGVELVPEVAAEAERQLEAFPEHRWGVQVANMNDGIPEGLDAPYDVVLGLAIFHKLRTPMEAIQAYAGMTRECMVIRLPAGSTGLFVTKHHGAPCDVRVCMDRAGFGLGAVRPGPRGELVQYWHRI